MKQQTYSNNNDNTNNFFKGITDEKQLKKEYYKLAKKYHSDNASVNNDDMMKLVNSAYDNALQSIRKATNKQCKADNINNENIFDYEFKTIIQAILKISIPSHITVEIVGFFIYIQGVQREDKEFMSELKKIEYKGLFKTSKFRYNNTSKSWYYAPTWYSRRGKKTYSMEEKRSMYGSNTINNYNSTSYNNDNNKDKKVLAN